MILWGEAALSFEADEFIEIGNSEPVIAIFVGTLVKTYDGTCFHHVAWHVVLLCPW